MEKINIFDEVDNIKLRAEKEILSNQKLLKLLSIGKPNPLKEPDIEKVSKLVDEYIFFKPKTFETTEKVQSFLLMDMVLTTTRNRNNFADIELIFRILVHNQLFELYDGRTRIYQISKELKNLFDGEHGSWMGKCEWNDCRPMTAPSDYQGVQLRFSMTDFK